MKEKRTRNVLANTNEWIFGKYNMVNSNLDYKAIATKFISLNEGLCVAIPQIIKHTKSKCIGVNAGR